VFIHPALCILHAGVLSPQWSAERKKKKELKERQGRRRKERENPTLFLPRNLAMQPAAEPCPPKSA
jgi:hypothetical protein